MQLLETKHHSTLKLKPSFPRVKVSSVSFNPHCQGLKLKKGGLKGGLNWSSRYAKKRKPLGPSMKNIPVFSLINPWMSEEGVGNISLLKRLVQISNSKSL